MPEQERSVTLVRFTPKKWRYRGGLYVVRCHATGRAYYGSTTQLGKREYQHLHFLRTGKHSNVAMQADWMAHGEESFEFQVLAVIDTSVDRLVLRVCEQRMLDRLNASECYNVATNALMGMRSRETSELTRERLRLANVGKKIPLEARANMSAAAKGRKNSPEWCRRMSEIMSGRKMPRDAVERSAAKRRGRLVTAEHRKNIGLAKAGRTLSDAHKEKIRQAHIGSKMSPEAVAKSAAKRTGQKRTGQALANIVAHNKRLAGRTLSPEHKEKLLASIRGVPKSPEHIRKVIEANRLARLRKKEALNAGA